MEYSVITSGKSLKREFTKTFDHNNKSGNDPKTCRLYDEFLGMYGHKASTTPQCTLGTLTSSDPEKSPPPKKRKARAPTPSPVISWLNDYRDDQCKYREEQRNFREEQQRQENAHHSQKLDILGRIVGLFESSLNAKK